MKCNKCGKEIEGNSKFCTGCGTAIEEKTYGNYRALLLILVFVAKIIQVVSTIFINGNLKIIISKYKILPLFLLKKFLHSVIVK